MGRRGAGQYFNDVNHNSFILGRTSPSGGTQWLASITMRLELWIQIQRRSTGPVLHCTTTGASACGKTLGPAGVTKRQRQGGVLFEEFNLADSVSAKIILCIIVVHCEGCVQRPHMANPECVGAPGLFEVRKTSWEYLEMNIPSLLQYAPNISNNANLLHCRNHYRSKSDKADYIYQWLQSYSDESALIADDEHKDKGKGKDENKVLNSFKSRGFNDINYELHCLLPVPSLPSMFIWTKESGSARGPFQLNLVQFPLPRSLSVFQSWRNVVAGLQGGH